MEYENDKQEKEYKKDVGNRMYNGLKKMIENMDNLFDQIKKETGIDVNFEYKVVQRQRKKGDFIEIESEDFASQFKVIKNAWRKMNIEGYGSYWFENNKSSYYGYEEDFSKPCPEIGYTMTISYRYQHHDGGTNGATIGKAYASEKTGWKWNFVPELEKAQ